MGIKILVVDDDQAMREFLRDCLRVAGHEVLLACDGIEALELARRSLPRVILLDIMMPQMHGFELCKALRGDPALAGVKVIILSAKSYAGDMKVARDLGADAYLTKPIDNKALCSEIERLAGPAAGAT